MAVAFESVVNVTPATGINTGASPSITTPATNPVVIVAVALKDATATVSSLTITGFGGTASQVAAIRENVSGDNGYQAIWVIKAPTANTSGTVQANLSASVPYQMAVMTYSGADQTNPCPTGDAQTSNAGNAGNPVTLTPTNLVTGDASSGSSEQVVSNIIAVSPNSRYINNTTAVNMAAGDATNTTGLTFDTDIDVGSYAKVAVRIKQAAAGTAHVGEATFSGLGGFPTSGFGLSPLQPDADSIDGTWTDQAGGTSLFAAIDEMSVDDADYIKSAANPANDICKISLGNPATTPSQPFIVAYRYEKTGVEQIDLGARLLQGATEIAAWSHSDISTSLVTAEQTLSGGQFAAISDFNDLFIEFTADQVVSLGDLGLEGDFSGDLTLEGDFSGSLTLEGS